MFGCARLAGMGVYMKARHYLVPAKRGFHPLVVPMYRDGVRDWCRACNRLRFGQMVSGIKRQLNRKDGARGHIVMDNDGAVMLGNDGVGDGQA